MKTTHEQKINQIILCIIGVFLIFLYSLYHYDFFNQPNFTKPKIEDAIRLGQIYSYALLTNQLNITTFDGRTLFETSSGSAKEKFQKLNIDVSWMAKAANAFKEKAGSKLQQASHAENLLVNEYDLELGELIRNGSYVDLKFLYYDFPIGIKQKEECPLCYIIEISSEGPMSYRIKSRYEIYSDNRVGSVILNKIFNFAPIYFVSTKIIHPILGINLTYSNTRGHWVVYDFDYNYNLNDYYNWLSQGAL